MDYSKYKYWFVFLSGNRILSINKETGDEKIWKDSEIVSISDIDNEYKELRDEFSIFMSHRPERLLYNIRELHLDDISFEYYLDLLKGSILSKSFYVSYKSGGAWDEQSTLLQFESFKKFIITTDIMNTPFSGEGRGVYSYRSGLLLYLCTTAQMSVLLADSPLFDIDIGKMIFCALTHRLDKVGRYIYSFTDYGKVSTLRIADTPLTKYGRGVSSIMLLSRFFNLSEEEQLSIRWANGAWHLDVTEYSDLSRASSAYQLVRLLQFAVSMTFG